MRLINNMADAVRDKMRSFLRITPGSSVTINITENLDFYANAAKNRIWYRGDSDELIKLYKEIPGASNRYRFWAAVPITGREIEKIHTGLPGVVVSTLVSVVMPDMNEIEIPEKYKDAWKSIYDENNFKKILEKSVADTLVIGDGVFRIGINTEVSSYPIIEFVPGDRTEYRCTYGRITEIDVHTTYVHKNMEYTLIETYGKGFLRSKLYQGKKEVKLNTIPQTENLLPEIVFDGELMLAVKIQIADSKKYNGRGGSIFDGKTENFDALDECWSQWMDALRKGRTKEYIPEILLPRNPETGEVIKPSAFDNAYIKQDGSMQEGVAQQIQVVQPNIPHESYLATYITALDLCLQGIISPSTLGIDTKKLDNADAQREKEKTTLYTRNKIVETVQTILPTVCKMALNAWNVMNKTAVEQIEVNVTFGEYANPSFESQVETVAKAKSGNIMSIEAAVEELYGDTKDEEWKEQEVARLKAEQGIVDVEEPGVNLEGVNVIDSTNPKENIQNEPSGI